MNQTFLPPFISYQTKTAVTLSLNTESTGNWEAASGEVWAVPINFQSSKLTMLGRRPTSLGIGVGYFAEKPDGGPEWKLRSIVTLLFPK